MFEAFVALERSAVYEGDGKYMLSISRNKKENEIVARDYMFEAVKDDASVEIQRR